MRPVGPEPSGVYWRRRLAILAAVLVVLLLVWFLFFRSSGSGAAAPSGSPSPSPTSSKSASPTSKPTSASPSPTSTPSCKGSDIGVTVSTDKKSYPVGSPVELTLTITNEGGATCTRDVGAKANTLLVLQDGEQVWSSDDCNPGGAANVVAMKPGDVYEVNLTWEGAVTKGSCPSNPPLAEAGDYEAQGKNIDVKSDTVPFTLT